MPTSTIVETAGTISQNVFIFWLLGSTVVATVVGFILGWVKDVFQSQRKEKQERKQKLYSALKFYLILIGKLESIQGEILTQKNKKISASTASSTNSQLQSMEVPFYQLENEVKRDWEKFADLVLKLLEENVQYIENKHQKLVEDIFETYFYQKIIYGEHVAVDWKKIENLTSELRTGKAMQFSVAIKNLRDELMQSR
jgi:hypothetical protein